jgi:hypothetical protein
MVFTGAGTEKVKIRLTTAGKRLLKHAKRVKLEAKGTFTPNGGVFIDAVSRLTLKR